MPALFDELDSLLSRAGVCDSETIGSLLTSQASAVMCLVAGRLDRRLAARIDVEDIRCKTFGWRRLQGCRNMSKLRGYLFGTGCNMSPSTVSRTAIEPTSQLRGDRCVSRCGAKKTTGRTRKHIIKLASVGVRPAGWRR